MATGTLANILKSAEDSFTKIIDRDKVTLNFHREMQFALDIVRANEDLRNANPDSVKNAILNAAATGLTLNPALKLSYLIPWKGHCALFVGYQGLVHMAVEQNAIDWVQADVVYEKDEFLFSKGLSPQCHHVPNIRLPISKRGEVLGAYAVWQTPDGSRLADFMPIEDLEKARQASKMKSGAVWTIWRPEMQKKCVVKRVSKLWQKTALLARRIELVNKLDGDRSGEKKTAAEERPDETLVRVIDEIQLSQINSAIDTPRLLNKILTAYNIETLSEMPIEQFDEAMDRISSYKAQRPAKARASA